MVGKYLVFYIIIQTFWTHCCSRRTSWFNRYSSKPPLPEEESKKEKVRVHLIPFSHNDLGWRKTFSDSYYGDNTYIDSLSVQYIYDGVIDELSQDPKKTFIVAEIGFFYIWWGEQSSETKEKFRKLLKNHQIEFVNGGWAINDEATSYYEDVIDLMTLGHEFLEKEFGIKPTTGFFSNNYGHSATQAALYSQMGIKAFFLSKTGYEEINMLKNNRNLEFLWIPKQQGGRISSVYAAVNHEEYFTPDGFCFDFYCNDDHIVDDQNSEKYNVKQKADLLISYWKRMLECYEKKSHVAQFFGGSGFFSHPEITFKNWDKLIKFINNSSEYDFEIIYGTPANYLKEIQKLNLTYSVKRKDFLPIGLNKGAFYSGFFSNRPRTKGQIKTAGRFLQVVRTFHSLASIKNFTKNFEKMREFSKHIKSFERALASIHSHEVIAGTDLQYVNEDFSSKLREAMHNVQESFMDVISQDTNLLLNESAQRNFFCGWDQRVSECEDLIMASKHSKPLLITVYNPSHARNVTLRVKLAGSSFQVIDDRNNILDSDIICAGRADDECDLYFIASMNELSLQTYKLIPFENSTKLNRKALNMDEFVELDAGRMIKIKSENNDFVLKTCERKDSCKENAFSLLYQYYESEQWKDMNSGPYIFKPRQGLSDFPLPFSKPISSEIFVGKTMTQITLTGERTSTDLRFFKDPVMRNSIEVETFLDSIPVDDQQGKEIIMKIINKGISSGNKFYTDSQGLELQERRLGYRENYTLEEKETIGGNYYPVNGMISIVDEKNGEGMYILNDRCQGGSSLRAGEVELMINRRLLLDDMGLVMEPLDEKDEQGLGLKQMLKHWILFEGSEAAARNLQLSIDTFPTFFYSAIEKSQFESSIIARTLTAFSLPDSTKVSLKMLDNNTYLLRAHNLHPFNSTKAKVPYKLEERSLSNNQALADIRNSSFSWNSDFQSGESAGKDLPEKSNFLSKRIELNLAYKDYLETTEGGSIFNLLPLQIRTFQFAHKNT